MRVRYQRSSLDSTVAAVKRLQSDKPLYIYATYSGYTIQKSAPFMQSYLIVYPNGEVKTVEYQTGAPKMSTNPWYGDSERHRQAALLGWRRRRGLEARPEKPTSRTKKPWQMTKQEWIDFGWESNSSARFWKADTREAIKRAQSKHAADREGWLREAMDKKSRDADDWMFEHRQSVRTAISQGKRIPARIIAEYPDLATAYNKRTRNPSYTCPNCGTHIRRLKSNPFPCPGCNCMLGVKP